MIFLTISKLEIIKVEYKGNEDAHDYLDIISTWTYNELQVSKE